jgi:hypothetical protein
MPEVRTEYPFQISYKEERIPGSLVCLRGETAEELGQEFVQVTAIFDAIFAAAPTEETPANVTPITPAAPAKPAANRPLPKLPQEALDALAAQKKGLCVCQDKWWDNRQIKTKASQPDFKCAKCGYAVWLTPLKGEGE